MLIQAIEPVWWGRGGCAVSKRSQQHRRKDKVVAAMTCRWKLAHVSYLARVYLLPGTPKEAVFSLKSRGNLVINEIDLLQLASSITVRKIQSVVPSVIHVLLFLNN